jgi:hypothetical protein
MHVFPCAPRGGFTAWSLLPHLQNAIHPFRPDLRCVQARASKIRRDPDIIKVLVLMPVMLLKIGRVRTVLAGGCPGEKSPARRV